MEAKKVVATGLVCAAAGAGAYFLFSNRFAPTRQRIARRVRENTKMAVEKASEVAGSLRQNAKTALKDVSEITDTAAKNL